MRNQRLMNQMVIPTTCFKSNLAKGKEAIDKELKSIPYAYSLDLHFIENSMSKLLLLAWPFLHKQMLKRIECKKPCCSMGKGSEGG